MASRNNPFRVERSTHTHSTETGQVRPRSGRFRRQAKVVAMRAPDAISLFAVIGFLVIIALVAAVMIQQINLNELNSQQNKLSNQLSALNDEYAELSGEYEKMFDMDSIESQLTAAGSMIQLNEEQEVYISLNAQDSVIVYDEGENESFFDEAFQMLDYVIEFFR